MPRGLYLRAKDDLGYVVGEFKKKLPGEWSEVFVLVASTPNIFALKFSCDIRIMVQTFFHRIKCSNLLVESSTTFQSLCVLGFFVCLLVCVFFSDWE